MTYDMKILHCNSSTRYSVYNLTNISEHLSTSGCHITEHNLVVEVFLKNYISGNYVLKKKCER